MKMKNPDRERLWIQLHQVSFAVDEVKLFLDVHPNDCEALAYYQKFRALREKIKCEYITKYGPLTADDVLCENHWTWIDAPWPWEREA